MSNTTRFITRQLFRSVTLLVSVSVIAFLLIISSPIDPVEAYIGTDRAVSEEQREHIIAYWGLDRPPAERLALWVRNLAHGDLGDSISYRQPVARVIRERFKTSLALMAATWVISGLFGFVLGLLAGANEGRLIDRIIKGWCLILASAPAFWIGILLLILFVVKLKWFPMGMSVPMGVLSDHVTIGDRLYHMVLPVLTLSLTGVSGMTLHTREKLIGILKSEPVLFAKARGETGAQILFRHGIRNIALPAITIQFGSFSELFGGSLMAERIFSYPGLGNATTTAAQNGDVPLLLALAVFSAVFVFTGNMIANILYGILDPRIREGEQILEAGES